MSPVRCAQSAAVFLLLLAACGGPPPPNVLILLMDTLRADRLHCYGHGRPTSPTVDSLAAAGIRYACFASADYTQASTASLFTGKYPFVHGYVNSRYALAGVNHTLAEILRDAGYRTGAFIANGLAGRKYGMAQGFEHHFERNRASAEELVDAAATFVVQEPGRPWFAYLHFLDVHDPYRAPPEFRARFAPPGGFAEDMTDTLLLERSHAAAWWGTAQGWWDSDAERHRVEGYFADYERLYDGAILYWDGQVRRLLRAIETTGQAGNTLVIVTSDHGEQLFEHGFFGHGNAAFDECLRVPLIVLDPRTSDGGTSLREGGAASLVDVLPTLCARLGLPVPDGAQGVDLAADGSAPRDTVYTEGTFMANRPFPTLIQSLRAGGWKLVLDRLRDAKALYHVEADPAERRDLLTAEPERAAALLAAIGRRQNEHLLRFHALRERSPAGAREERLRELQALGYVAGGGGGRPGEEFLPLRPVTPTPYGPFGDEPGLEAYGAAVDLEAGGFPIDQIVAGLVDSAGAHRPGGAWFDRRASVMLRRGGQGRVCVEVTADTLTGSGYPRRLTVAVDGVAVGVVATPAPGAFRWAGDLPAGVGEYVRVEVSADHRFLYRPGASPRSHVYASFRLRAVRLLP